MLVEDHAALRQSLALLLEQMQGFRIVAHAGTGAEARAAISEEETDVAVVDLGLPDADGAEVIRNLREAGPHLPVLVLTVHHDPEWHARALQAGAKEVLTKDAGIEEVLRAIRCVADG